MNLTTDFRDNPLSHSKLSDRAVVLLEGKCHSRAGETTHSRPNAARRVLGAPRRTRPMVQAPWACRSFSAPAIPTRGSRHKICYGLILVTPFSEKGATRTGGRGTEASFSALTGVTPGG